MVNTHTPTRHWRPGSPPSRHTATWPTGTVSWTCRTTGSLHSPAGPLSSSGERRRGGVSATPFDVQSLYCRGSSTFSSLPSLQSVWPSHSHSGSRHSLLRSHRSLVGQATVWPQPSSSDWSLQSGWPSQCMEACTHSPLEHWNSVAPQFLASGGRQKRHCCHFYPSTREITPLVATEDFATNEPTKLNAALKPGAYLRFDPIGFKQVLVLVFWTHSN